MLCLALCLILVVGISGCGSQATKPAPDSATTENTRQKAELKALLAEARTSQSPQKESLLIQAASLLQQQGKLARARKLLEGIDTGQLDIKQFNQYTLAFSDIALEDDAYFLAQGILANPRLDRQWPSLTRDEQIILRRRRADLFMLLGETETSIDERLQLSKLLPPGSEAENSNQDNLWQSLMTLATPRLQQLAANAPDAVLRGWYQLALINKNNRANLEKQLDQVTRWQSQWPQHPASRRLPEDLRLLQRLVAERPRQVALLLPQHGRLAKAGIAVRDGFMAAYFQAQASGGGVPVIRYYDSAKADILNLYQQAVDEGAQLVVGPLDKANVALLEARPELPVPVLAVNYLEGGVDNGEVTAGFYQFGLAIEDEARQLAQRAWLEGHRYAMILAAQASWGKRSADIFTEYWQSLGGTVVAYSRFSEYADFADAIGNALLIDQSQERFKVLRRVLGRNAEFEPRRRQDVDMLLLVALPEEARQINPTLAFHYASELPVYATSQVYDGTSDAARDRDLNDIRFPTLPWYFDTTNPEKREILQSVNPTPSYQRLYALGVDSFYLHPRLPQLQQSPLARLYGVTGALSMSANGRIEREQVWAQIVNGKARQLPALVSSDPAIGK